MKPPRAYACGILHFFGGIRRSTYLAYSAEAAASAAKAGRHSGYGRSDRRIHPRAYPAFVDLGYYGGVGRPWPSAKADNTEKGLS